MEDYEELIVLIEAMDYLPNGSTSERRSEAAVKCAMEIVPYNGI